MECSDLPPFSHSFLLKPFGSSKFAVMLWHCGDLQLSLALVSFHFTGLPFSRLVGRYPQVHCSTHRGSGSCSWCRRAMASNHLYHAMLKRCEDWLADPFADEEGEQFDIEEFIAQVSEYVESVESGEEVLKARLVPGPFWWKTFCFLCWWFWWLPNSKSPAHWEVLPLRVAGTFHSCKVTAVTLYNVQCAEMDVEHAVRDFSDAAEVSPNSVLKVMRALWSLLHHIFER